MLPVLFLSCPPFLSPAPPDVLDRFESLGGGDTKMTYELLLEFGFVIPEFARKQIVGAIMQTALESLKDHIEKKKR